MSDEKQADGQYARVEIMGHRVVVGRVSEVARFGVQLCCVEPIDEEGEFGERQLYGGAAIFCMTELPSKEAAIAAATPYWKRASPQLPEHDDEQDEVDEAADGELF